MYICMFYIYAFYLYKEWVKQHVDGRYMEESNFTKS